MSKSKRGGRFKRERGGNKADRWTRTPLRVLASFAGFVFHASINIQQLCPIDKTRKALHTAAPHLIV